MKNTNSPKNSGRRRTRRRHKLEGAGPAQTKKMVQAPIRVDGAGFSPLSTGQVEQIHEAALKILENTGLGEAEGLTVEILLEAGARLSPDKRLLFPRELVEQALSSLPKHFTLYGRSEGLDLELGGRRVSVGSGGAAPNIFDLNLKKYRPSELRDLYDAARVVDTLEHLHFFSRPLVARDMDGPMMLDVNTAFACLAGTSKHVISSASSAETVREVSRLCHVLAGSGEAFRAQPFLSLNINHTIPPLRFDPESCGVLIEAVGCGIPVMVNTFGQLGASSPVTLAGCLAQTMAETLAGMILAWAIDPDAKAVFGPRPMITDLRTGAMSGGSGEQAVLTAASIQMAQFYGLPNSTIAGATDSKVSDAQSGYEKSLTVALTALAGANLITQAGGSLASLMGISLAGYIIDNDMLGSILKANQAIEVNYETLDVENIHQTVTGAGHFLGEPMTLARMNSDFLYPRIADRRSISEWESDGDRKIDETADRKLQEILQAHFPSHIDPQTVAEIRSQFEIALEPEWMTGA